MSRCALVALVAVALAAGEPLCGRPYCHCDQGPHPAWTTINCTLLPNQELVLSEGVLPESASEVRVAGGARVAVGAGALSRLKDARLLLLEDTRLVQLQRFSAVSLPLLNLQLTIRRVQQVRIHERAFTNLKGPLSLVIEECEAVWVGGEAFSWLLSARVEGVARLRLEAGAFALDPTAANVGEHGPGLALELRRVALDQLPAGVFGSSAARLLLHDVRVDVVRRDAFSANTYNELSADNCSFGVLEQGAFASRTLVNELRLVGSQVGRLEARALQSAVGTLRLSHTTFDVVESDAINITVASAEIADCVFVEVGARALVLSSWNELRVERNKFARLAEEALVARGSHVTSVVFTGNEVEAAAAKALAFVGRVHRAFPAATRYQDNYFGQPCHCGAQQWLHTLLDTQDDQPFVDHSYCTVDEFFARCFNVPEQNMRLGEFVRGVCSDSGSIRCEPFVANADGAVTHINNPKFPQRARDPGALSDRDKKIIGIVVVTAAGCVLLLALVSLGRWARRQGHCASLKAALHATGAYCARLCACPRRPRPHTPIAIDDYSERQVLHTPPAPVSAPLAPAEEPPVPTEDRSTQTLPEELTKELLESLRRKLDDPADYAEARETIEHLYELIKVEEGCNASAPPREHVYSVPWEGTAPRVGRRGRAVASVGTGAPSLERLAPRAALSRDYSEPRDLAVHLYAEVAGRAPPQLPDVLPPPPPAARRPLPEKPRR